MKLSGERMLLGSAHFPKTVVEEHIERYRFSLGYAVDMHVLDMACGTGYGSEMLSHAAKAVVAADIDEDAVNYAVQNYQRSNISYRVADVYSLPFLSNTFDLIVSFETIEHVDDPIEMLNEFHRVLKKRGRLIISTPNRLLSSRGHGWRRPFTRVPLNPFHRCEFSHREFVHLLEARFNVTFLGGQRQLMWLRNSYFAAILYRWLRNGGHHSLCERLFGLGNVPSTVAEVSKGYVPAFFVAVCLRKCDLEQ